MKIRIIPVGHRAFEKDNQSPIEEEVESNAKQTDSRDPTQYPHPAWLRSWVIPIHKQRATRQQSPSGS
jgi:hypothetical protein